MPRFCRLLLACAGAVVAYAASFYGLIGACEWSVIALWRWQHPEAVSVDPAIYLTLIVVLSFALPPFAIVALAFGVAGYIAIEGWSAPSRPPNHG